MKKNFTALILLFVFIFSLTACSFGSITGDYSVVAERLRGCGYNVVDLETPYEYEVLSCLYANMDGKQEEIYVIYCSTTAMANKVHEYVKNKHNNEKSELEMKAKILEYAYKTADIDDASKVEHYENYLQVKEELKKYNKYSYGRNYNMVWYGTKQTIKNSKG